MRFRVKIDTHAAAARESDRESNRESNREAAAAGGRGQEGRGVTWGPFSAAVASGKFRDDGLRDSEAEYDLGAGRVTAN